MTANSGTDELNKRLVSSSVFLGMLPEAHGYNGSAFLIDDSEADRIAKDISDAVAELTSLKSQLASLQKSYEDVWESRDQALISNKVMRDVLQAARTIIQEDREGYFDCHVSPTSKRIEDKEDMQGLAEYDNALKLIDQALAEATKGDQEK